MIKRIAVFILAVTAATASYAQDEPEEQAEEQQPVNEIVVSARGYTKPVSSTPGGVGVVQSDSIEKTGPVSISDALQEVPGVYRSSDGSWGSEISIRGAGREKVVLLIDGCRVNTATDIGAQFGTILPMSVERIEVLKGPISSLYGSGTIGGVVNVITRTGKFTDKPGFESGIAVSGESNAPGVNTYGFTGYNSADWYVFASGGYRTHMSYRDGGGDKVNNTGFSDAQGTVNMGFKPAAGHTVELRTQYYRGWDIGVPGAKDAVPSTAVEATSPLTDRALVSMDYIVQPAGSLWKESKIHLYWQYLGRNMKIVNPPAAAVVRLEPSADHNTWGAQWTNTVQAGDHTIVAGLDTWMRTYRGERKKTSNTGTVTKDKALPDCLFLSSGIFAEDDWALGDFTLNLGARGDYIYVTNDRTVKTVTPAVTYWEGQNIHDYSWNAHLGLTYAIMEELSTSILAASGYRAASLEERYKYITGTVEKWGNPDLDPERSYFFEYALHLLTNRVTSNASVYANVLRDLIAEKMIQELPKKIYELQNVSEALLWGAEYDIDLRIVSRLSAHGTVSWVNGRDTKNDNDLPSIAPLRLTAGLTYEDESGIGAFFDTVYTAEQNKVPSGGTESPDWVRLDAGISWKVKALEADHRVFLTCTNILDARYYDYLTMSKTGYVFNEPGRNFRGGYSVTF